jgi:translation initiation factor IF-3
LGKNKNKAIFAPCFFVGFKLKRINTGSSRPFNRPFRRGPQRPEEPYKVNERITAQRVRVVGENIKSDVYPVQQAIKLAQEQGLDLVEISPNADPPVCKVVDYSKFKYEQKKKQKEIKAKTQKVIVKEIRFGPNTEEHDFNFKVKHAETFLKEGFKVKSTVTFFGRSIVYKERGEILLLKFAQALEEVGKVEALPRLEGKRMSMLIMPKAGKK